MRLAGVPNHSLSRGCKVAYESQYSVQNGGSSFPDDHASENGSVVNKIVYNKFFKQLKGFQSEYLSKPKKTGGVVLSQ